MTWWQWLLVWFGSSIILGLLVGPWLAKLRRANRLYEPWEVEQIVYGGEKSEQETERETSDADIALSESTEDQLLNARGQHQR